MSHSSSVLSDQEIAHYLSTTLSNWSYQENALWRKWGTHDWRNSMRLALQISELAERHQHHPQLTIKYSEVIIELFSHDVNAITMRDIELAQDLEKLNSN
jgi:4a-hydroxytetrahydrobiopterin dehydratase